VVLKRGADRVVVIYTEENEKELVDIRARYRHYGLPLDARKVEPWSYEEVLSEILEVVLDYPNHEVEFNISCGTRVMTTAAYMAALFTDSPVLFVSEVDDKVIGDLIEVQPISVSMLTSVKRRILADLVKMGGCVESQRSLGSRVELGVSSISKHLRHLEAAGYIKRSRKNRRNVVEITGLGRVVLRLKEVRKERIWNGDELGG